MTGNSHGDQPKHRREPILREIPRTRCGARFKLVLVKGAKRIWSCSGEHNQKNFLQQNVADCVWFLTPSTPRLPSQHISKMCGVGGGGVGEDINIVAGGTRLQVFRMHQRRRLIVLGIVCMASNIRMTSS